jgi:hypothetical protein
MRLVSLAALGVGFVLGARAGEERYEQIRKVARSSARRLEAYGEQGSLAARSHDRRTTGDDGAG